MIHKKIKPPPDLATVVECYWVIEFDDSPQVQKIIPDGFPELIFHYKDEYLINLYGQWEKQGKSLVAGQVRKYFQLKNTGPAGMFGIKLKPTTLTHLFGIAMHSLTDKVLEFSQCNNEALANLDKTLRLYEPGESMAEGANQYLRSLMPKYEKNMVDEAVELIQQSKGSEEVNKICELVGAGERNMERLFKKFVGLPPKLYSRIVRFSNIFQLIQQKDPTWSDLVFESGYYDQSHFIRNFKSFTGEDPSKYFFDEPSLANFFLKK